jgi:hypothetical protein
VKLVVTVDVEEDQWGMLAAREATVHNARRLRTLQNLFDEFAITPTYLLTYPVVTDPHAAGILREIVHARRCEIGTHCHPWNTPPYEECLNKYNSMLCNLPTTLQFNKLQRLHAAIQDTFEVAPVAFRSGRWGFDAEVARNILRLNYRIDTSVTPYTSWTHQCGPDFSYISPQPYLVMQESSAGQHLKSALAEIPVTIGYLHGEFQACETMAQRLGKGPWRRLKLGGLLSTFHVLRKVWLSPEMETPARMIQLVRQMRVQGYEVLNLVFHSSALMAGCGPFIRTVADEHLFLNKLKMLLNLAKNEGVVFISLSEAARLPTVHSAGLKGIGSTPSVADARDAGFTLPLT